jgi:hypothetical protein
MYADVNQALARNECPPIKAAFGRRPCNISSCFALIRLVKKLTPVMLLSGRLRLMTTLLKGKSQPVSATNGESHW